MREVASASTISSTGIKGGGTSGTVRHSSIDETLETEAEMHVQLLNNSPQNRRGDGQVSYLLLAPSQFGSRQMAITLVEGAPGSQQALHAHSDSEQVYVIVTGRGRMTVSDEQRDVGAGSLVFIPAGSPHAIHNPGPEKLVYVSATAPPFEMPTGEFADRPPTRDR